MLLLAKIKGFRILSQANAANPVVTLAVLW
jgi:hypothetical protein